MIDQRQPATTGSVLLSLAALVVLVAGIKAAQSVVVLILTATVLAVVSAPATLWLQHRRVPTVIAVLLVVVGVMGAGLLLVGLMGTSLDQFTEAIPTYQQRLQALLAAASARLDQWGIVIPRDAVEKFINPGAAIKLVSQFFGALGSVLANGFVIVLTAIFMLLEASTFTVKLQVALGRTDTSFPAFREFTEKLNRYVGIKTWVSALTGVLVASWLWLLGVDFPLMWGLLAFLLNYVPNIGSIIAAVPAVLLTLIQLGPVVAAEAALGFLAINLLIGNVIEPRFMGRGLGLSTLVVFLSLIVWGWILGPVGMLLSVPLTMTVRIALDTRDDTRWIAVLLGPEPRIEAADRPGLVSRLTSALALLAVWWQWLVARISALRSRYQQR